METEDLSKETTVKITLGHLLLAWEVLSDKFSDLRSCGNLSEEEMRAIWGLADLLEKTLIGNGVSGRSQEEWKSLVSRATDFIRSVPADFLNEPGKPE
jgi:hypothetical protein